MKIIKTEIVQTFEDGSKSTTLLTEKARQDTYEVQKHRQFEHNLLIFEDGARIVYKPSWLFMKVEER